MTTHTSDYQVVSPDDVKDVYAGSDVPGEWHSLTDELGAEQVSMSFIRVPPHSDFDQGTGHFHEETEEFYLVTRGTLTMRFGDEIRHVSAPAAVRVGAQTPRSCYRNEKDEPAEAWAISRKHGGHDATKLDDFWEASPDAEQHR
jgi:mannose-6-phosphate isomerase-like protein (cupin superfamily)